MVARSDFAKARSVSVEAAQLRAIASGLVKALGLILWVSFSRFPFQALEVIVPTARAAAPSQGWQSLAALLRRFPHAVVWTRPSLSARQRTWLNGGADPGIPVVPEPTNCEGWLHSASAALGDHSR